MKRTVAAFALALMAFAVQGQKLLDIYKKGTVRLIPDAEYAKGNDWEKVFRSYYDTIYGTPMGSRKSLMVMPDGSVIVNHRYRNYYSRFSPSGKFEKEFGIRGKDGNAFREVPAIEGIINNTFFTWPDNAGNILFLDFDGHYIKTLKLGYTARQIIALPGNKLAVTGWAIQKKFFHDFVSLINLSDGREKIIWEHYTVRSDQGDNQGLFRYSYRFSNGKIVELAAMPYLNSMGMASPPVIYLVSERLIVSVPSTGEILTFNAAGEIQSKSRTAWPSGTVSVGEQKELCQKAIDNCRDNPRPASEGMASPEEIRAAYDQIARQMQSDLDKIKDPIPLPAFSTIIKDSDGNLLYFEYPKKENANKFNVWVCENGGRFVCQSSFTCDDYELNINPSKLVFRDGYIYGLQLLKKSGGLPLRLVRFRPGN